MPQFNRWKPTLSKTLAYFLFQRHHEEINNNYWAHRAAFRGAFSLTKGKKKSDPADSVLPNPNAERRRAINLGQWADDYNEFDNWTRLAAVIAVTGYLEVFIRSIVDAACQSCPAVAIGGEKEINGVQWLKTKATHAFIEDANKCAKGEWGRRLAAYQKLFGTVPQFLQDNLGDLEKLRVLRNAVGHAFGRNLTLPVVGRNAVLQPARRVTHERLIGYLDLAYNAAKGIEGHLSNDYVGSYETIAMYHRWE
jgi:hypothetical protein